MLRLIPPRVHRALMPLAHRVRHHWRRIARPQLRGVTVIAANEAGEVLLIRHSYGSRSWSLPSGGCGRHEDPSLAARREVREELDCELAELEEVAELNETLSGAAHAAHIFSAKLTGEPRPDRREVTDARFFSMDALPSDLSVLTRSRLSAWQQARGSQQR